MLGLLVIPVNLCNLTQQSNSKLQLEESVWPVWGQGKNVK